MNATNAAVAPVAIVTGGAGEGIGHGLTQALVAQGWRVVITDRKAERAERFVAGLPAGAEVEVVVADVLEPDAPQRAVAAARARFGRVDGLVNNVGVGLAKPAGEIAEEEFMALFNVDFLASFRFVKAALPELRKARGAVVNIGSVHAKLAAQNDALYAASKAALEAFTRGLAVDSGRDGVRANIVHPGLVDSPQNAALLGTLTDDVAGWVREFAERRQCLPELASAREVGELVAFLLGPKARSITGQAIYIDGGTTTLLWNRES